MPRHAYEKGVSSTTLTISSGGTHYIGLPYTTRYYQKCNSSYKRSSYQEMYILRYKFSRVDVNAKREWWQNRYQATTVVFKTCHGW